MIMARKLSEVFEIDIEFNFFNVISTLEPFKLDKLLIVINNVLNYLTQVKQSFVEIETLGTEFSHDLDWLSEGKAKFYEIYRNIDSIDTIVTQSLNLLEENLEKDETTIIQSDIFDKLDELSEKSLNLKKQDLILFKSLIDISVEFNDISIITMDLINNELENCLKICFRIHEKRFSSPVRHAPTFNLDILTKKLLQESSKNLKLPLLNELDRELYQEYIELKSVVEPLKVSMVYIPTRIEEFKMKNKNLNFIKFNALSSKFNTLLNQFNFLENELNELKYELIDKRWDEIFSYLNTEISFLISSIEKDIPKLKNTDINITFKEKILKKLRYIMEIVENTFTIINQAIEDKLINFAVVEKSNKLAEQWLNLKDLIPDEFLIQLENEISNENSLQQDMQKLSIEDKSPKKFSFQDKNLKLDSNASNSEKLNKRKSRAGEFLIGKLNLKPVLIENNPQSTKKISDLLTNNKPKILKDSIKHNIQDDASPSKRPNSLNLQNIPDLKPMKDYSPSLMSSTKSNDNVFISPGKDDEIFNDNTNSSKIPNSDKFSKLPSKLPLPASRNFVSRIPKPSVTHSKFSELDRDVSLSRLGTRSKSSLDTRPSSSLSHRREVCTERAPSRVGVMDRRHSMVPQTPVRSVTSLGTSRRQSMLMQPTPVKDLLKSEERKPAKFKSPPRIKQAWK